MDELRTPDAGLDLAGHVFLGRGPEVTGAEGRWSRAPDLVYRCAACGTTMPANHDDFFTCACGVMHADVDMHRFGSSLGDMNILVYRKTQSENAP